MLSFGKPLHDSRACQYDLSECDREPIHALGYVQPFGALLAVNSDWSLAHYSANAEGILQPDPDQALSLDQGANLAELLLPAGLERLDTAIASLDEYNPVERIFNLELTPGNRFDCAVHKTGDLALIDIDPHPQDAPQGTPLDLLRPLTVELESADDLVEICRIGAAKLKTILGYDRVMVYRFHQDGSGEVISEQREPEQESFKGLRYPRTDIPEQARALYLRNRFRIIADVDSEPVPILPEPRFDAAPLDLSLSMSRAVSPVHIQYLKNMGVGASLSISIVHRPSRQVVGAVCLPS